MTIPTKRPTTCPSRSHDSNLSLLMSLKTENGETKKEIRVTRNHSHLSSSSRHERARLYRTLPNRLQNRTALLLPRAQRFEQLDDLVALALAHVVDADHAHLDVIVEQKIEQGEQSFERVVVRLTWECAVGDELAPHTLDGLCDAEELQPTTNGTFRGYL
jgi:hypothetical protein